MRTKQPKPVTINARITRKEKAKLDELSAKKGTTPSETLRQIIHAADTQPRAKKGTANKFSKKDDSPPAIYATLTKQFQNKELNLDNVGIIAQLFANIMIPMSKTDSLRSNLKRECLTVTIMGCWSAGKKEFTDIISALAMLPKLKHILQKQPEGTVDFLPEPNWILEEITDEILGHLGYPQPPRPLPMSKITYMGEGI